MRKSTGLILCVVLILGLTGCGEKEPAGKTYDVSTGVDDIMRAAESEYAAKTEGTADAESKEGVGTRTAEDADSSKSEPDAKDTADPNSGAVAEDGQTADNKTENAAQNGMTETVAQNEMTENTAQNEMTEAAAGDNEKTQAPAADLKAEDRKIDVDLTQLSSTMVYSEVFAMMMAPEDYDGKTVRMSGLYNYYHDAMVDKDYSACVVQDATACCAQGIDFVLTDDYDYPDDYPEIDEEITVTGVFNIYKEGKYDFFRLKDAVLE